MRVLLLAPDSPDRTSITDWLHSRGYTVSAVNTAAEAIARLATSSPRFSLVDLAPRNEALKFLRYLVTDDHAVWTVAIANSADPETTVEALRLGVVDIVPRPLREAEVTTALANAREFASLASRAHNPEADRDPGDRVLTVSPRMREVQELAQRMAPSRCPVLLVGERGTGRETVARMIHRHGPIGGREFWKIAAGLNGTEELLEFSPAGDGTLFIEELGELPPNGQSRLERILAGAPAGKPGNGAPRVRVIAAAQPNIDELVQRGVVDHALVDALSVLRLELPTLRQRPQDIPALALHFLKSACQRHQITGKSFSRSALALFASLPWRGNAAELEGLVERLAVLVPRGVILQEDVLQHVQLDHVQSRGTKGGSLRDARREFERDFIGSVLLRHQWRIEEAAAELGIERTNLYRKMKQLRIVRSDRKT